GAAVVETDPLEGSDGAYLVARKAVFADPEHWYYPDQYNKAEQEARRLHKEVVGFYHSHPDHAALPSDFDRARAFPFYSYIIVAVGKGQANDMTSWELAADRSCFEPEEIERAPTDSRG
ncbi:Mov34/MPN/PAD-1 family protein, partial [Treponema endosymbiont of Eucomonympha sp.]|uniref:Mov34/MPN/PAD-1 family protein n=1 Tax=Treponema endosymbiont of Eucomonympha sp. TaxID=1580831 RepID=UPI000B094E11